MSIELPAKTASRWSASPRPAPGAARSWGHSPGKYGHGVALTPQAETLSEALLKLDGQEALDWLLRLHSQGQSLEDIEESTLEPAIRKVGELWLRGRIDDSHFASFGSLAEGVERQFRAAIAGPASPR